MDNGLFSLVSQQRIETILETLHNYTELPLQLLDSSGIVISSYGIAPRYCMMLISEILQAADCTELHRKASHRAQRLGKSYVFTCHAGLNYIVFPLIDGKQLFGSVLIGPFLMDKPDSTLISTVTDQHMLTPSQAIELYDRSQEIPIVPPNKTGHLSKLVDELLIPLFPTERLSLLQTQGRIYQQARLNEAIQNYKGQETPKSHQYFYEKEQLLLSKVKIGDTNEAKALLNELLGYVLLNEGRNEDTLRLRAVELITLLSRVAIAGGAGADMIYDLNGRYFSLLENESSVEQICYTLQDVVESFMSAMFTTVGNGNIHVRKALQYIGKNYSQQLTLEKVALDVGLSPNYFSKLFEHSMGTSFRDYLNHIRIEESERLLLSTNYSLTDIAIAVGYSDQSYFCRIFHKITGITPGQFRK